MFKARKKSIACFLVICFFMTLFPLNAVAFIPGKDMGTIIPKQEPTFNQERFRLFKYWDVINKATGEKLGESAACQEYDYPDDNDRKALGWKNFVDVNTLEAWVEAFNGNLEFVKSELEKKDRLYELLSDSDGEHFWRYWIRDIAYASGAYVDPEVLDEENHTGRVLAGISWGPTLYPITVEYKMKWEYEKGRRKCTTDSEGKRKCRCTDYESHSKTRSGTATVQLLVNGTGVNSLAQ